MSTKKKFHNSIPLAMFSFKLDKSEKGNLRHDFERFSSRKATLLALAQRKIKFPKHHLADTLKAKGVFSFVCEKERVCVIIRPDTGKSFREIFKEEIQKYKPEGTHHLSPLPQRKEEKIVLSKVEPVVKRVLPESYWVVPYLPLWDNAEENVFSIKTSVLLKKLKSYSEQTYGRFTPESLYDHIESKKYLWITGGFVVPKGRVASMIHYCKEKELFLSPIGLSGLCLSLKEVSIRF